MSVTRPIVSGLRARPQSSGRCVVAPEVLLPFVAGMVLPILLDLSPTASKRLRE